MSEKVLKFLRIIYQVFKQDVLSFIEYISNFQEILEIDVIELLGIYSFSLENGYIKAKKLDNIYLTDKAMTILNTNVRN